jgi:hypothetical protein
MAVARVRSVVWGVCDQGIRSECDLVKGNCIGNNQGQLVTGTNILKKIRGDKELRRMFGAGDRMEGGLVWCMGMTKVVVGPGAAGPFKNLLWLQLCWMAVMVWPCSRGVGSKQQPGSGD